MTNQSLEEVLPYNLKREHLNIPCLFEQQRQLADQLTSWEDLASVIGLNQADISAINKDHPNDFRSKCSAALNRWEDIKGKGATYLNLAEGLLKLRKVSCVEKLCEIFRKYSPKSSHEQNAEAPAPDGKSVECSLPEVKVISTLPPAHSRDLTHILETNLYEVMADFAYYTSCVQKLIQKKNIDAEELYDFLIGFTTGDQRAALLPREKLKKLKENKSTRDIFHLLKEECTSFLNYDVYERIVQYFELDKSHKHLNYPQKLKDYVERHTISEFIKLKPLLREYTQCDDTVALTLVLKIDAIRCKLDRFLDIVRSVAKVMDLQPSMLLIYDIKESCVEVTFLIPKSVADSIFTSDKIFSEFQREEFRRLQVQLLKCNGYCFEFIHEVDQASTVNELLEEGGTGLVQDYEEQGSSSSGVEKEEKAMLEQEMDNQQLAARTAVPDQKLAVHPSSTDIFQGILFTFIFGLGGVLSLGFAATHIARYTLIRKECSNISNNEHYSMLDAVTYITVDLLRSISFFIFLFEIRNFRIYELLKVLCLNIKEVSSLRTCCLCIIGIVVCIIGILFSLLAIPTAYFSYSRDKTIFKKCDISGKNGVVLAHAIFKAYVLFVTVLVSLGAAIIFYSAKLKWDKSSKEFEVMTEWDGQETCLRKVVDKFYHLYNDCCKVGELDRKASKEGMTEWDGQEAGLSEVVNKFYHLYNDYIKVGKDSELERKALKRWFVLMYCTYLIFILVRVVHITEAVLKNLSSTNDFVHSGFTIVIHFVAFFLPYFAGTEFNSAHKNYYTKMNDAFWKIKIVVQGQDGKREIYSCSPGKSIKLDNVKDTESEPGKEIARNYYQLYYKEALKVQGTIMTQICEFDFIPSLLNVSFPLTSQGYTFAILLTIASFALDSLLA